MKSHPSEKLSSFMPKTDGYYFVHYLNRIAPCEVVVNDDDTISFQALGCAWFSHVSFDELKRQQILFNGPIDYPTLP
ncbi:MAG: hypothetical protein ACOYBQ_10265 [Fluviibacter sp.]